MIEENISLWIYQGDYGLTVGSSEETLPPSLFFVPTLESVRYNSTDQSLTFNRHFFIPCSLSYQLFYTKDKPYITQSQPINNCTNENETSVISILELNKTQSLLARILFGSKHSKTDFVTVTWVKQKTLQDLLKNGAEK